MLTLCVCAAAAASAAIPDIGWLVTGDFTSAGLVSTFRSPEPTGQRERRKTRALVVYVRVSQSSNIRQPLTMEYVYFADTLRCVKQHMYYRY